MNSLKKLEQLLSTMSEDDARALLNAYKQTEARKAPVREPVSVGEALGEFRIALSTPTIPQPEPLPCECCGRPLEHVWCPVGYGPAEYQGRWLHPGKHDACLDRQMWAGNAPDADVEEAFKSAFERAVDDSGLGAARYQVVLKEASSTRLSEEVNAFIVDDDSLGLFGLSRKEQRLIATLATYRWLYLQFMQRRLKKAAFILSERTWLVGLKESIHVPGNVPTISQLANVDFVCLYGLGEMEHCSTWEVAQMATLLEAREANCKKTLLISAANQDELIHCRSISRSAHESIVDMLNPSTEAA